MAYWQTLEELISDARGEKKSQVPNFLSFNYYCLEEERRKGGRERREKKEEKKISHSNTCQS